MTRVSIKGNRQLPSHIHISHTLYNLQSTVLQTQVLVSLTTTLSTADMSLAITPSFPSPQFYSSPVKSARNHSSRLQYPTPNYPSPIKPDTFRASTVHVRCSTQFHSTTSCAGERNTENSKIGLLTFILEGSCVSELDHCQAQNWDDESLEPSILVQDSGCSLKNRYPHLFQSFLAPSNCTNSRTSPLTSTRIPGQDKKSTGSSNHPSSQKKRVQIKRMVKSVITSLKRLNKGAPVPSITPRTNTIEPISLDLSTTEIWFV